MSGPAATRSDALPCVLGAGSSFEGLLSFQGGALVAGRLGGEVCAEGTLWVGEVAEVRARIEVDALVVAGSVEGEIRARGRVELLETARVRGSIHTPRLSMAAGAWFEGQLEMAQQAGVPEGPSGLAP